MTDPEVGLAPHSIEQFREGYEEGGRLRGFQSGCGFRSATWGLVCPRCGKRDLTAVDLSGRGTVVAYSIQHVPSDEFLNDAPYAYVLVALVEGGRISGWMDTVHSESELAVGDAVHWVPSYKPGVHFEKGPGGPAPR